MVNAEDNQVESGSTMYIPQETELASTGPLNKSNFGETAAGGESLSQQGATIRTRYHDRIQDAVGVDVNDLEEFKAAGIEEFRQFVIGEFLVAGAFWLGIERAVTVQEFWRDLLFWFCFFAFIAGCTIGFFGYRQLRRRKTRIDRIISDALSSSGDRTTTANP